MKFLGGLLFVRINRYRTFSGDWEQIVVRVNFLGEFSLEFWRTYDSIA